MTVNLPPAAQALAASRLIADGQGVELAQLYGDKLPEAHLSAARRRLWRLLRQQKDEAGRPLYTQQRVASWFGVTRSAVAEAERAA